MENTKYLEEIRFVNSKKAAEFLDISIKRLFNLTSCGKIPYYKFGKANRYSLLELKKLIEKEPRGIRDNGN